MLFAVRPTTTRLMTHTYGDWRQHLLSNVKCLRLSPKTDEGTSESRNAEILGMNCLTCCNCNKYDQCHEDTDIIVTTLMVVFRYASFNSLGPSDTIWRHRSEWTLAQVMTCLTAPSHYLTQCWLITSEALWLPSQSNFTKDIPATNH